MEVFFCHALYPTIKNISIRHYCVIHCVPTEFIHLEIFNKVSLVNINYIMYEYVRKIIILLSFELIYDLRRLKVAIPKGK